MANVRQQGFTLVELVAAIGIILVMAAILFPVFAKPHDGCCTPSCNSNERQLTLAFMQYAEDYDDKLPARLTGDEAHSWRLAVDPYVKNRQVFACPRNPAATQLCWDGVFARSYGVNGQDDQMPPAPMAAEGRSVKLSALAFPERLILIAESNQGWSDIPIFTVGGASFFCGHRRKANFAFCDGHVKTMTWAATGRPFNLWQIDGWDRPAPASLQANLASVDKAGR